MSLEFLNANGIRVSAYLLGGVFAVGVFLVRRREGDDGRGVALLWLSFAVILVVLGLARIVDFGPWLTSIGRHEARIDGWYDQRREVQGKVAVAVAGGTVALTLCVALVTLVRAPRLAAPSVLLVTLLGFLAIRAISLHQLDAALYQTDFHGLSLNTASELGLTLLFCTACLAMCIGDRYGARAIIRRRPKGASG